MAALDAVEWEAALLEPVRNRDAERFVRKHLGVVPPGARYFLDSLWVTQAAVLLSIGHVPMLYVSPDLAEMLALVVSQEGSCRYCYAATRSVMKILGFAEARIRRLEEDFLSADLRPTEKAALEFARSVARAAPLVTGQHPTDPRRRISRRCRQGNRLSRRHQRILQSSLHVAGVTARRGELRRALVRSSVPPVDRSAPAPAPGDPW
jgi:alkylhydroperoxidase family enzyme